MNASSNESGSSRSSLLLAVSLLGAALLTGGCGGREQPSEPDEPSAVRLVAEGWARYEESNLGAARRAFQDAETLDPNHSPAPHGLAWTLLRLGDLSTASAALDRAAAHGFSDVDLGAARALIARDLVPVDWARARTEAEAVLNRSREYRFTHDASLDWRDFRLLIAQASFALQDYARVAREIVALGETPPNPGADDYVATLLVMLDEIGARDE